jgi:serine phosphatase RsbU (regulator of sigma subunit)
MGAPDTREFVRTPLVRYGVALVASAAAVFAVSRLHWLEQGTPFVLLLAAVAIATWHGGLGPGLLAIGVVVLSKIYLFLPPFRSLAITDPADLLHVLIFILVALLVSSLNERLRAAQREAEAAKQQLATSLQQERSVAQTLTESFLGRAPNLPGFEIASLYQPASKADRIGGDYFDFILLNDQQIAVVIGDVCGKGLKAALYATTAKYMLRAYARDDAAPRRVLARLNQALVEEMDDATRFLTLFYGVLDLETSRFTYVDAGHPPPVLYDGLSASGRRLAVTGGVVGGFLEMTYEEETVSLGPGSALLLFTDGITEAAGRGETLEDAELIALASAHAAESADAILRALFARAQARAGGSLTDDAAIIVIRRDPAFGHCRRKAAGEIVSGSSMTASI